MELCLRDLQPFYLDHITCRSETLRCDQIAPTCDTNQTEFERKYCTYSSGLSDACTDHTACRTEKITLRNATHADVKKSELARKSDYITGTRISCLFRVFEASNTNKSSILQECDGLSVNTSTLDIIYPDIAIATPCTPEPTEPCDSAWKSTEYQNKAWYGKVTMENCAACVSPTASPTPAPTPPPPQQSFLQGSGGYCTSAKGCSNHKYIQVRCLKGACMDDWMSRYSAWEVAMLAFQDKCLEACNAVDDCVAVDDQGADYLNYDPTDWPYGGTVCNIYGDNIGDSLLEVNQIVGLVSDSTRMLGSSYPDSTCPVLASCLQGTDKPGGGKWETAGSCYTGGVHPRNCWCKKGAAHCFNTVT